MEEGGEDGRNEFRNLEDYLVAQGKPETQTTQVRETLDHRLLALFSVIPLTFIDDHHKLGKLTHKKGQSQFLPEVTT